MDLTTLTPAEIAALAPADLASHSAEELGGLATDQVAALTSEQIAALDPDQLAAIEPMVQAWQQLVNTFQSAQAQAAADARAAFLEPLNTVLASPEFATVKAAIEALGDRYEGERFASRLKCLVTGLSMTAVA